MDIDVPEPVGGRPPWENPAWRAQAVDWIDAHLAEAALSRDGAPSLRGRMWSVVMRVPLTAGGTAWFKANPPGSAFEPAVCAALLRWEPEMAPPVFAVDRERAWSLSTDGGLRLGELRDKEPDPECLATALRRYARLQRDLARRTGQLAALGVPDLRPALVPEALERLLADPRLLAVVGRPGAITQSQWDAVRALVPEVRDWCAELDAFGIRASLDHADLHPHNVFGGDGSPVPFDWGDAVIAHPFGSLLVALRSLAGLFDGRTLAGLRDAYLEPWRVDGFNRAELRRAAELAVRISPVSRATAWGRVFPCFAAAGAPNGQAAAWLARLLDEDLIGAAPGG